MRRGEIWWAEFDERRPVVLLSGEDAAGFRAMQVVAPADTDISGLGIEVAVGVQEGLPFDGVLRFVFPRPGFTPCTWLTTLSRDDLIELAGAVSAAKLSEIDDALRASEQRVEWTPAAAARLSEIKGSGCPNATGSAAQDGLPLHARQLLRIAHRVEPGDEAVVDAHRQDSVELAMEPEDQRRVPVDLCGLE
jgi:mRNA interferase MazF